ncbi:cAMP-binding domain of CRP or a regulatory subunit of cAMP-dependent protein kinases [Dyadobacter soli]|uniref:cAMP-binding domain of CRP or a regulatory subunit of cAMP-dependent protein kinases n=1 Tax=Dyadobacter soli TaxID=659014 RepID=A0A1G6VHC5_9BACT|nr:Crp/Fnr family transcriptional regulator [Dyadobacter soli]SDD52914.1 cAMP-binding domain of CRP or a regulatory subunit of cAMP-dependent protein kinases [Dyadobacter soli]
MDARQILKENITKIVELTDAQLDDFYACCRRESFRKGQFLIREGDEVTREYFVLSGCLKTYFLNDELKMTILQFAMPTWWASDYMALYNHCKAAVNVDCVANAEVLSITAEDRERMCHKIDAINHFYRWRTNRGYAASQKRLLSLMTNDTKKRYEDLLVQYPTLFQLVPKHLIASYLGVSRETLSRLYHASR